MMPELSTVVIRCAHQDDVNVLSILLVQSFNQGVKDGSGQWLQSLLRLSIRADLQQRFRAKAPYYRCLVATSSSCEVNTSVSVIVGTVELSARHQTLWPLSNRYLYLSNLAVQSDYRRQGIACKLLRECEKVAIQWGFTSIYLHVKENNTPARQLYERVGYRLKKVDFNLGTFILGQPQTLFLGKQLLEKRR